MTARNAAAAITTMAISGGLKSTGELERTTTDSIEREVKSGFVFCVEFWHGNIR